MMMQMTTTRRMIAHRPPLISTTIPHHLHLSSSFPSSYHTTTHLFKQQQNFQQNQQNQDNQPNNNDNPNNNPNDSNKQQSQFFKILFGIKEKAEKMSQHLERERKQMIHQSSSATSTSPHKLTTFRDAQEFMWHEGKSLIGLPRLISDKNSVHFPATPSTCTSLLPDSLQLQYFSKSEKFSNSPTISPTQIKDFDELKHVDIVKYLREHHTIRACLVTISFTAFSAEMARTWIDPFYTTFQTVMYETRMMMTRQQQEVTSQNFLLNKNLSGGNGGSKGGDGSGSGNGQNNQNNQNSDYCVKMFDVSVGTSPFARFMRSTLINNMRKNTPEHLLDHSLACYPTDAGEQVVLENLIHRLDMYNSKNCYVFLLDGMGRVRWRGAGNATEDELRTLKKLTIQLVSSQSPQSSSS